VNKLLTIWIPTYRRPHRLIELLDNLRELGLTAWADVIVSDNDPDSPMANAAATGATPLPAGVAYRCNPSNLSAGVNFLRAFEHCRTPWLMIVGDDELFESGAVDLLALVMRGVPRTVLAVKFDSGLFGAQKAIATSGLQDYVNHLKSAQYADAFNNLCLVSNWLFRTEPYQRHLAAAYLGYSSKISHLFPLLRACAQEGGQILFSSAQPVRHGSSDDSSWPKAPTWFEMAITLTSFCGFVERADRAALLQLVFHTDWRRMIAKCLRVHQFYGDRSQGFGPWRVHAQLALVSSGYRLALLLTWPLLLLPASSLPGPILRQLGDPGRIERW
jgi:glycosyltransferase involved in cell wall biosynthesis